MVSLMLLTLEKIHINKVFQTMHGVKSSDVSGKLGRVFDFNS